MLKVPAPFPQVGSYALFIDPNLPAASQRAELVRIQRRYRQDRQAPVAVSFPLRVGASGYINTTLDRLIDATPLTKAEEAELATLRSHLSQQARPNRKKIERAEALRTRQIYADVIRFELHKLERLEAKGQPSIGSRLPRDANAVGLDGPRNRSAAA